MFCMPTFSIAFSIDYRVRGAFSETPPASILISLPTTILEPAIWRDTRPADHGACSSMSFGQKRGYSDCIRGVRARNLLSASEFATSIGRGLNTAIDINWSRTTARDDIYGDKLAAWRKAAGRFLRECGAGGLTCTWVRERPTSPIARPNAHLNCHIPPRLYDAFVTNAHRFLPRGCVACGSDAIYIQTIGSTGEDHRRRTEYLLKGAHPRARLSIERKRISQGRILRKRCGTSKDIGLASRLKEAEVAARKVATNPVLKC